MGDLFEEDDDAADGDMDAGDDFAEVEHMDIESTDFEKIAHGELDARRRLESMLDEKRLRDELEDFGDY